MNYFAIKRGNRGQMQVSRPRMRESGWSEKAVIGETQRGFLLQGKEECVLEVTYLSNREHS